MLRCVAVCCVLPSVVICCRVLQQYCELLLARNSASKPALVRKYMCCNVMQCVAACFSVLCVAVCCASQGIAVCCASQCVAV